MFAAVSLVQINLHTNCIIISIQLTTVSASAPISNRLLNELNMKFVVILSLWMLTIRRRMQNFEEKFLFEKTELSSNKKKIW